MPIAICMRNVADGIVLCYTDHSFPVTHSTMTRKTTALYQGVFDKLHALMLYDKQQEAPLPRRAQRVRRA